MAQHTGQKFLLMGSSTGMGREIALEVARQGGSAILTARHRESLEKVQRDCQSLAHHPGQSFEICAADLTLAESPMALGAFLSSRGATLDGVLINGGGPHGETVTELSAGAMDTAHALLFKGPVLHLQAALPVLRNGSSIVAITSTTVVEPNPLLTLSGSYRSALTSYLKGLSVSLGSKGIRVNSVAPGYIETEKLDDLRQTEAATRKIAPAAVSEHWAGLAALGRLGTPQEIAKLVSFLFSKDCTFLTGQIIVTDGGQVRGTK